MMVGGGGYSRKWEKGEGDWVLGTARPVSVVFLSIKEEKTLPAWLLNKSTFSHWLCTTDTTLDKQAWWYRGGGSRSSRSPRTTAI